MRNFFVSFVVFLTAAMVFSSPAVAQVYYPAGTAGHRTPEAQKAAEASKNTLKYDPHDLSGIWRISNGLMGGAPAPPMTAWGREQFDAHKPSDNSPYRNLNEGNGACDPPRMGGAADAVSEKESSATPDRYRYQ